MLRSRGLLLVLLLSCLGHAGCHRHGHRSLLGAVPPVGADALQFSCVYDEEAHLAVNGLREAPGRVLAELAPAPIRITPVFQLATTAALSQAKADFVRSLIPAALAEIARYLGTFYLPWSCASGGAVCVNGSAPLCSGGAIGCATRQRYSTCFSALEDATLYGPSYLNCTSRSCAGASFAPAGRGLPDTDFLLYVTAVDEPYCQGGDVLAMGAACEVDPWSGRPLSGNANFCPHTILVATPADGSRNAWGMQLDTAIHEALHTLGFSASLFTSFVGDDGAAPASPIVAPVPDWVNATVPYVVSPTVLAEARAFFDAPDGSGGRVPGVPLENSGGGGTSRSHWEARWMREDMMAGAKLARSPFSRITQALLADSGWYAPTGGALTPPGGLRWGAAAGAAFLRDSCAARALPEALQVPGWCDAAVEGDNTGCTQDKRAAAFCGSDSGLEDGCSSWVPFANVHCWDPAHGTDGASLFGQLFGRGSRCMTSNGSAISRVDWGTAPASAGCYPMRCAAAPVDAAHPTGLRLLLTLAVCTQPPCAANGAAAQGVEVECPAGGVIDLATLSLGFTRGMLGPCPADVRDYCAALGCPGDCGGDRGVCVNPSGLAGGGVCVCHPGYVGDGCGEVACTPAACAARNATCSALTGRCVAADGEELPGTAVLEPTAVATPPVLRLVQVGGAAATAASTASSAAPRAAPGVTAAAVAVAGVMLLR